MRLLILVLAVAGMAVFFWQNRQPLPLVFFGGSFKAQLPLAAWVLLFAAAGALSSLTVRGLNTLGRKPAAPLPPPRRPSTPPQPPLTPESSRNATAAASPAVSDWQPAPQPESEEWDEWAEETTAPAPKKSPDLSDITPQLRNFETPQQPEKVSREGSVYSYRYRESKERPQETPDSQKRETPQLGGVVDANYRVIAPPYRPPSEPPPEVEDDEEWV